MPPTEIQKELFLMQDIDYKNFHSKLIPTIDPNTIIGVRTPLLRKFASTLFKSGKYEKFMKELPHQYYEENNLHGFLIEKIKDYDKTVEEIEKFLPYIDNWATCDMTSPKIFKKHLPELTNKIKLWIKSNHTYTVRFGINMLMTFYLDDNFSTEYSDMVSGIKSDEYYINMSIAWYFATALAKHYDDIIPYLTENRLSLWTHNKTIRKAIESYRITEEQKKYLRTLIIYKK